MGEYFHTGHELQLQSTLFWVKDVLQYFQVSDLFSEELSIQLLFVLVLYAPTTLKKTCSSFKATTHMTTLSNYSYIIS